MFLRRVPLWCWWGVLALIISAPWDGFISHVHWERVDLLPFTDPDDNLPDIVLNVVFFVPFGYSFLKHRRGSRRVLVTMAAAFVVSVCAESLQLFSHSRNTSGTDIAAAASGALAGAVWRRRDENVTN
jgi:glycopeptide antibiotics resistance protein